MTKTYRIDPDAHYPFRECWPELMGATHPVAYKLLNEGKVRTFKVGRKRFVTGRALLDCIADLEAESS